MRAELRGTMCTEVESLENWSPPSEDFAVEIRLIVGPEGAPGEESFDVTVCTGGWLAEQAEEQGIVDPRHHLVVAGFDWSAIRGYLEARVKSCTGENWDQIGERLGRLGYWEFEDYDRS